MSLLVSVIVTCYPVHALKLLAKHSMSASQASVSIAPPSSLGGSTHSTLPVLFFLLKSKPEHMTRRFQRVCLRSYVLGDFTFLTDCEDNSPTNSPYLGSRRAAMRLRHRRPRHIPHDDRQFLEPSVPDSSRSIIRHLIVCVPVRHVSSAYEQH